MTIKEKTSENDDMLKQQVKDLQRAVASLTSMVQSLKLDNESLKQDNESLRNSNKKKDKTIIALTQKLNKLNNTGEGGYCCLLGYMKCFWKGSSQKQLEDSTIAQH